MVSLVFGWFSMIFGWFLAGFGGFWLVWVVFGWFGWFLAGLGGFWLVWVVFGWFRILAVTISYFCQSWSKTWAGKELIWGKWAIFYFHIMLMHKEVWGKLVTFDLFSA